MKDDLKPRFVPDSATYFREENESYASFISPGDHDKALELLNPAILEVARRCDGEHTVAQIKAQQRQQHADMAAQKVDQAVDTAVALLSQYALLSYDAGVVPAAQPELDLPSGQRLARRLEEDDFRAMRALLTGHAFPELPTLPRVHYINPYLQLELYNELFLRTRMFNHKEVFFGVFEQRELKLAVGLMDNLPVKPVFTLSIIVGAMGYDLEQGLELTLPLAREQLSEAHYRLGWQFACDRQAPEDSLHPLADKLGWRRIATVDNEFGAQIDELQYVMDLEQKET